MTLALEASLIALLEEALTRTGPVLFLTGAGLSAESGIPTFRGKEGYWKVGSKNYHPQELATRAAFLAEPEVVWAWYLHRARHCAQAKPGAAHYALAEAEPLLGERFLLITQNVDGLHPRAGNSRARTYSIHGSLDTIRCFAGCPGLVRLPEELLLAPPAQRPERLQKREAQLLRCAHCAGMMRPHILLFDESYDENYYRFESCLRAASEAALVITIGTSGATQLPLHVGSIALQNQACMLVINPETNPFFEMAKRASHGLILQGTAGTWTPKVVTALQRALQD